MRIQLLHVNDAKVQSQTDRIAGVLDHGRVLTIAAE